MPASSASLQETYSCSHASPPSKRIRIPRNGIQHSFEITFDGPHPGTLPGGFHKAGFTVDGCRLMTPDWYPIHHRKAEDHLHFGLQSRSSAFLLLYVVRFTTNPLTFFMHLITSTRDTWVPFHKKFPTHARDLMQVISTPLPYGVERDDGAETP